MKRILYEDLVNQVEKQKLIVHENQDKIDYLQAKLLAIEKNMPVMIQELLEYFYDKKMSDLKPTLVTMDQFKEKLSVKLDYSVFRDH